MLKVLIFLVFYSNAILCIGQDFFIPKPKHKKNEFAKNFITLLNDAPNNFNEYKDRPIKKVDSIYPNKKVFGINMKLPGAIMGKLVMDTIPFAEFTFPKANTIEDAEAILVNISNQITEAMNRRVLLLNNEVDNKTSLKKQVKIAYGLSNGFFLHNVFVQIHKNNNDESYVLRLKINSGKPPYFFKIMKNEPVNSFMFVTAFKTELNIFQKYPWQDCLGNLEPFTCIGTKKTKDAVTVMYTKTGIEEFLDGKKEFENWFANIRVCMSDKYVYYIVPKSGNKIREMAFIKFDDIDKKHAKTLHLSLIEKGANDYVIELDFVY
jgi:hypothetical protein